MVEIRVIHESNSAACRSLNRESLMIKNYLLRVGLVAAVGAIAFFGYRYWQAGQSTLPKGIASGNGRIEAKLVDVAAKEALRVKGILADEGDLVHPGQILVCLDTATLEAQLAEARLNVIATQEKEAITKATIIKVKSQIELAKIEVARSSRLVAERAGSQRDLDVRRMALASSSATLQEEEARLKTIRQEVNVAQARVVPIQTRIDDAVLKSPVEGRVLYRLTEVGEVVAAGGKALTLVNLGDVYMEIFLPSEEATKVKIGAEGRITVDPLPGVAAPGYVSFVSPEAQFTPKQVETRSEREKLMFRVKIQVPEKIVEANIEAVKTGVRGVGYVKVDDNAVWPDSLQNLLQPPIGTASKTGSGRAQKLNDSRRSGMPPAKACE
jgi:HlyD family secretion protein